MSSLLALACAFVGLLATARAWKSDRQQQQQQHTAVRPDSGLAGVVRRTQSMVRRVEEASYQEAEMNRRFRLNDLTEAQKNQVHCLFVTSCDGDQGHSQVADLLQFSAMKAKQPGPITHIVYGCSANEKEELQMRNEALFSSMDDGPQFYLHFADNISTPSHASGMTRAMPKVQGIADWVKKVGPRRNYIAILDADFIFLSPLTAKLQEETYGKAWHRYEDAPAETSKGVTLAAHYVGFFPDWKGDKSKYYVRDHDNLFEPGEICRGDSQEPSPCDNLTNEDISDHSVGPPYMLHSDDMRKVAPTWLDFSMRLAHKGDTFHADMHGWMLAIIHLGLRQVRHGRLMMSAPHVPEKWGFVDTDYPLECSTPATWKNNQLHASVFLHYCQHYKVGGLDLYKGEVGGKRVKLSCNSSYRIPLPKAVTLKSEQERRHFFGYCTLANSLNELLDWKCGINSAL